MEQNKQELSDDDDDDDDDDDTKVSQFIVMNILMK